MEETIGHGKCTKQPAEIVAMNVKSHLSQDKINQFTATNVSQIINQKEATAVEVDLVEIEAAVDSVEIEAAVAMVEIEAAVAMEEIDHEKCTK